MAMAEDVTDPGADTNYSLLPVLRHYEERRCYPRIELRLPVIVTTAEHEVLHARLRNLCAEGVQIRCGPETAAKLHPLGTRIAPGAGPQVMLRMDLPLAGGTRTFAGAARLSYIAAKNRQEIAFGLEYTRIGLEAKQVLAAFIVECMRPSL